MKEIIIITLGLISFVFLVLVGFYFLEKKTCLDSYSDFEPQYGLWTNCRISLDGKLMPVDMVKEIEVN